MTCIVDMTHEGRVWIGGDSAGVDGWLGSVERSDRKVFRNGEVVMGFTTSFRMGDILRYRLVVPPINTWDVWRWASVDFVDAARQSMKDAGWLKTREGREDGGTFLLGVRGHLIQVSDDWQAGVPASGYAAVGCGF